MPPTPAARCPWSSRPSTGLVIESDEVALGDGLALVRGVRLRDAPPELRGDEYAHRRRALARGHARRGTGPRAGRPPPAPPADRAAAVGRRRAGARADRLGAHGRRPVAGHPARDRRCAASRDDCLRRAGRRGPAARVLRARRAAHPARGRARVGAAALRARLRARRRARGADRLAAGRPRAAGRAGRARLRAAAPSGSPRSARVPDERDALVDRLAPGDRAGARRGRRPRARRAGGRGARRRARRLPARGAARRALRPPRARTCGGSPTRSWPTSRRWPEARISAAPQVRAHVGEPLDVMDVVLALGHDDQRRVAERGAQMGDVRCVARGQRRELARRRRRRAPASASPSSSASSGGTSPSTPAPRASG